MSDTDIIYYFIVKCSLLKVESMNLHWCYGKKTV